MEREQESRDPIPEFCISCRELLRQDSLFCSNCGHRIGDPPKRRKKPGFHTQQVQIHREWKTIQSVITFYILLLFAQIGTAVIAGATKEHFAVEIVGSSTLVLITMVFSLRYFSLIGLAYGTLGFRWHIYVFIFLASIPIFLAVYSFVYALGEIFHMQSHDYMEDYKSTSIFWAMLFICIIPAVFEELGFRGFMFGLLKNYIKVSEAMIISSCAFAIIHLSVFAFFSHTLLGLYFCFLRSKSNSMYPSMLAHFMHNFLVIMNEYCGIIRL